MENSKYIEISVRELVEFTMRSGSIDANYVSSKRMKEGTAVHTRVQKDRKKIIENYMKEVTLSLEINYNELTFFIDGRADGVFLENNQIVIEEIKSTNMDLEEIEFKENHWHMGQGKMYAFIYANKNNLKEIDIMLTYAKVESKDERSFRKTYTIDELKKFLTEILGNYYKFARLNSEIKEKSKITSKKITFPFKNYRNNQREFSVAVYKTIESGKKLFAEAPTGTGKTISTLFPAIKAYGENLVEKIFYATSKNIARQVAENGLFLLEKKGLFIKAISMTAKNKICFKEEVICTPENCEYAKGHFDRVNDFLYEILNEKNIVTREVLEEYCKKWKVCPFEVQFDLCKISQIVIGDYNYVYDPKAQLKALFGEDSKAGIVVLVDEAHNLCDRARDMFSTEILKSEILEMKKIIKSSKKLEKYLGYTNKFFLEIKELVVEKKIAVIPSVPDEFVFNLMRIGEECDKWLADYENKKKPEHSRVLEIYFKILDFTKMTDFFGDHYKVLVKREYKEIILKLFCLDPNPLIEMTNKICKSVIYFSATLTPLEYFGGLYGGSSLDYSMVIDSPFEKENACVLVDSSISTYYKERNDNVYAICSKIYAMYEAKAGNYFVFFSSYEFMEKVYTYFTDEYGDVDVILQTPNMDENHKSDFLNKFSSDNKLGLIGFLVLGGVFSEGIDLIGERLIGVCVVGVGIPMITEEREMIKTYFEEKIQMGFEYAYMYPGMNKVLQGAGRLIRCEDDRGVILLLDKRFAYSNYKGLFPKHWNGFTNISEGMKLENKLNLFWNQED